MSAAAEFASGIRSRGGTVVFTNGVFDLLHPGHVRDLPDARAFGDAADRAVRSNKGEDRSINPETERAEVLLALESSGWTSLRASRRPPSSRRLFAPASKQSAVRTFQRV